MPLFLSPRFPEFLLVFCTLCLPTDGNEASFFKSRLKPLVISHRGSPGMLPEHTVEGYELALQQGADVIECDVAVSKDLKLLCTHEAWLNETTDVHLRKEFGNRIREYYIPRTDEYRTDYFTIDFSLDELKSLKRVQVFPFRDQEYNYKFNMASLDDYIAVAKNRTTPAIIYVETKNPDFFNNYLQSHGTNMENLLLESLKNHGYVGKNSSAFIESYSIKSLQYMSQYTELPLVYLTKVKTSSEFMSHISKFISVICPRKDFIVNVDPVKNRVIGKTDFIERAKSFGLKVHTYTFRNENRFLAFDYGADPYREYATFVDLGVDGMFTDFPWSLHNFMQTTKQHCEAYSRTEL